jgi:hypothetical protein
LLRFAGQLALGAMLLQLMLSFGHVHARDFPARLDDSSGWTRLAGAQLSNETPSTSADDDDLCAICMSASLLANSFVPDMLQPVVLRDAGDADRHIARAGHIADLFPRGSFQPRAPPAA